MINRFQFFALSLLLLLLSPPLLADVQIRDSSGRSIQLTAPAQRIVVLSPDLTEDLFAIGAGDKIVGRVEHADFPPEANQIPLVGDYERVSVERILQLKPDLVVAWQGGNSPAILQELERFHLKVARFAAHKVADIGHNLISLGILTGNEPKARDVATGLKQRWQRLSDQYAGLKPSPVLFYQLWGQPLMTVSRKQIINEAIEVCGARNPFADLAAPVPQVDIEAVIAAHPDMIVSAHSDVGWQQPWQRWTMIPAVANGAFYELDADKISRPTPRFLEAVEQLCQRVDRVRQKPDNPEERRP